MGDQREIVKEEEIRRLVEYFAKNVYRAKDGSSVCEAVERKCQALFGKDYQFTVIHNGNGELCSHYPTKLIIQEYEVSKKEAGKEETLHDVVEPLYDIAKLRDLMHKSRLARCRGRFVVPVILYNGRHICRSATLAGGAEIYGRSGLNYIFSGGVGVGAALDEYDEDGIVGGASVSSSEKIDKERRYDEFCLISTPYPGCEFFKDYRDNGFNAKGIKFDWSQQFVDASLSIPDSVITNTSIDWHMYRAWDLIKISQNYLKLLLSIITKNDSSLLIHCISGWDRTPLFISLLRLSLWADGKVNASLSPLEMLYLTISYDWMLFGHNLSDRLSKGEDIFFFCFNFLRHITSSEFSVVRPHRTVSSCSSESMVLIENSCSNLAKDVSYISSTSSSVIPQKRMEEIAESLDVSHFENGAFMCNSQVKETCPEKSADDLQTELSFQNHPSDPVNVPSPHSYETVEEASISSAFGSWQVVSGSGSIKDSVHTPHSSPISRRSDKSSVSSISTEAL
ncbi:Myotubularin-related protein 14 [Holothuria leucospilota]|uniref:Myotubularin-related protein 14 n=1 Tax=Holothuria leucospilota TaxID=206669 RepID=A0A9Q1HID4_HOLLE|nr:Myotubularin-related protein 14 [Holothuria leucospilota]